MNIFIWAPCLQKVGTTTNVENLISSFLKYSKTQNYQIDLINVFGEWDNYKIEDTSIALENFLNRKNIGKTVISV